MNSRVPPIDPRHLRDPVDSATIDRGWDRLEEQLRPEGMHARRISRRVPWLVAASFLFASGLATGHWLAKNSPRAPSATAVPSSDPVSGLDVLAAGSRQRTFALPGGGRITLSPGATVEIVHTAQAQTLEIRLLQGVADLDVAEISSSRAIAVLAGEATVSTGAGSVFQIKRNADQVEVSVSNGSVHVDSPAGPHDLVRGERLESLPVRFPVTSTAPTALRPVATSPSPAVPSALAERVVATSNGQEWRYRANAGDMLGAMELLHRLPGGLDGAITSARSASELMDLHDVLTASGQAASAIRALSRIVDEFPNDAAYAQLAAIKLGDTFRATGQHDKAHAYYDRARGFAAPLAEDALCRSLRAAATKDDAVRLAREYLASHPDGRCKDDAERILGGEEEDEQDLPADAAVDR